MTSRGSPTAGSAVSPCHQKAKDKVELICSLPPGVNALAAIIHLPLFRSVSSPWAMTLIERPWSSTHTHLHEFQLLSFSHNQDRELIALV